MRRYGEPEGNSGGRSSASPSAAGHFSLLCVPSVRVTWRHVCARTRRNNREKQEKGQASVLPFEYLEGRGHILFRTFRFRLPKLPHRHFSSPPLSPPPSPRLAAMRLNNFYRFSPTPPQSFGQFVPSTRQIRLKISMSWNVRRNGIDSRCVDQSREIERVCRSFNGITRICIDNLQK